MPINVDNIRRDVVYPNIKGVGTLLEFKEVVSGAYDPEQGSAPTTENLYTFYGAVMNYVLRYSGESLNDKLDIQVNDRKVYVAPNETNMMLKPRAGNWYIKWEGQWWSCITVKTHAPAGVPVMFEIQMRLS